MKLPPVIDLSKYVGKKVRVLLEGGIVDEGIVKSTRNYDYPFSINLNYYSNKGKWKNSEHKKYDILTIEEIQMNTYQELENKVKEMQAEIDRLKAKDQEQVRNFRNDINGILSLTQISRQGMENLTDKICDIVKSYIPGLQIEREDYDHGYNDAIYKIKKNLGLDT